MYISNRPFAVTGRVLAYTLEDRENYRNYIGKPVCVGPNWYRVVNAR